MIITGSSVFRHIPKTGGMWVRQALCSIALPPFNPKDTDHSITIPAEHADKYKFTFVRNPWSWYVSFYNYKKFGSNEEWLDTRPSPEFNSSITFEDFVTGIMQPKSALKTRMVAAFKVERLLRRNREYRPAHEDIAKIWSSSNMSMYNCLVQAYTGDADYVGKMESLRPDLLTMLTISNELTPELEKNINTLAPINQGRSADYRGYYSNQLRDLVAQDSADIISRFGYEF